MSFRVAALQTAGNPADLEANVRELENAAATATADGASLLITPELFLTGYNIGDEVRRLAVGDPLSACRGVAAAHRIALIVGYPELAHDGALYNSAAFIDPSGDVLDVYRKTHLFGESDRKYFSEGPRAVSVVDYRGLRIATMICYDAEFPENARMAALAGAHLIAVPTAQMQPFEFVADTLVRARAWENQVYVAYVNHDGVEGDTTYVGRSSIVGPDGSILDRLEAGTGLLWADVDPLKVRQGQRANPYLADMRPSLYRGLTEPPINLGLAARMSQAAVDRAADIRALVSAAVVDQGGHLVHFQRMDKAEIAGPTLAVDKAFTAVAHRIETAELAELTQPGASLCGLQGNGGGRYVVFGGGIPCWRDGLVVGAVGVSGGTVEEDIECARAALVVFESFLTDRPAQ